MRQLEEVLSESRECIFRFADHDFWFSRTEDYQSLRRELEAWEATLESNMHNVSMGAGHYLIAQKQLAEVRSLLVRPEVTAEFRAAADIEAETPITIRPRKISQESARALMAACEMDEADYDETVTPEQFFKLTLKHGRDPEQEDTAEFVHRIRRCALAAARADLAGEGEQ